MIVHVLLCLKRVIDAPKQLLLLSLGLAYEKCGYGEGCLNLYGSFTMLLNDVSQLPPGEARFTGRGFGFGGRYFLYFGRKSR